MCTIDVDFLWFVTLHLWLKVLLFLIQVDLQPFNLQLNADLRKLAVNMVPFPRLHFFVSSESITSMSCF